MQCNTSYVLFLCGLAPNDPHWSGLVPVHGPGMETANLQHCSVHHCRLTTAQGDT